MCVYVNERSIYNIVGRLFVYIFLININSALSSLSLWLAGSSVNSYLQKVGSSSLTGDQTWAPLIGSAESPSQGHKGTPSFTLVVCICIIRGPSASGFPAGSVVKNPPASAGDTEYAGPIPGLGRSPGGGHGNPLQYSCLENPMDRGAWRAIVHRIARSRARLKCLSTAQHSF